MEIWVPLYGSVFVACHLISVLTPCLECVHASVDEFMSIWLPMFGPAPMHSLMETWVPLFVIVHVSQSPCLWSHTFFRMCTCISTWIYVHLTSHILSTPMHSLMETGCSYMAVCLCPSHLISVPTPCLECVHASVHEFMSTWLSSSGPAPMHTLMSSWVPLYDSVFVSQSPHFCSHTLFRMCTCISTWIYVHLTVVIWSSPYAYFDVKLGAPVWQCVCIPVISFLLPHLVSNVYMHQYMYLCPP